MLVSAGIQVVRGLVNAKPLGGLSMMDAFQDVANEIFAVDSVARLREGGFFETGSGTKTYAFTAMYPPATPEYGRIRKIRGVYDSTLNPTSEEDAWDYGRARGRRSVDQRLLSRRVYADHMEVEVDNERQEIIFSDDPGTTSSKWKSDYYLCAPVLTDLMALPVLPGWENRLFIIGAQAWWERARMKGDGPMRAQFLHNLALYTDGLEHDYNTRKFNRLEGVKGDTQVVPQ